MVAIDSLKPRNRRLRDVGEKSGSIALAGSAVVGLLFLLVLVWQIAAPTVVSGTNGEIAGATEFIPENEFLVEWKAANWDGDSSYLTSQILIEISWDDSNGSHVETLNVRVIEEQYISADVHITESGLSENTVEVSKKEDLAIISSMNVPVKIEQISGPVPAADPTGLPEVGDFVIPAEVTVLWGEGPVFEAQELLAWISLLFLTVMLTRPIVSVLPYLERAAKQARYVKIIAAVFALGTMSFGTLSAFLGGLCWWACGVTVCRIGAGVTRLREAGREIHQTDRLLHSISNREDLLLSNRMLIVFAFLFIPLEISIPFLTERFQDGIYPYASGLRAAFYGTIWTMTIAMIVAIPISVGAAIYLEEYAEPNRITKLIQALVTNLAGVPSIVFGMFGLAVFVQQGGLGWGLGPSILAAGLTMGVMAMPIVVLASQEALRSVPSSLRESAFGVGCTRWQVVRDHIMPSAMPGIMTGSILAMSRIMGEAAPLIVVGAAAGIWFDPDPLAALDSGNPFTDFTVIPVAIYQWTGLEGEAWKSMAAAASVALIGLLVAMNSVAIILRQHFRKRLKA